MVYRFRNFQNNFQMAASVGWFMVIFSILMLFIKGQVAVLTVGVLGGGLILWQLRGKRVIVDTGRKLIKSGFKKTSFHEPVQIFINRVRISQNINSRVSSANVKYFFYQAYLQDGEEKHLISCNRKEERDMEKLKALADELGVELKTNY